MIINEAEKKEPINPMNFMSEDEVNRKNEDFKSFEKALRFGVPHLCDHLVYIYKSGGLDGLKQFESDIRNMAYAKCVIEGTLEFEPDTYKTKEEMAVAVLMGKIVIDWKDAFPEDDEWEDPAEADFSVDE